MSRADIRHAFTQPLTYVGVGVMALIIVLFVYTIHPSLMLQQANNGSGASNNETAYQNVLHDSLAVYKARYAHYPASYQLLLQDINAAPDIYGVNQDGIAALTNISDQLNGFSYSSSSNGDSYQYTYQHSSDGKTVTVTNK